VDESTSSTLHPNPLQQQQQQQQQHLLQQQQQQQQHQQQHQQLQQQPHVSGVRVKTPSTPQTPQMCSIASSPSELGGCNSANNNNNNNNSGSGNASGGSGVSVGVVVVGGHQQLVGVGVGMGTDLGGSHHQVGMCHDGLAGTANELTVYDVIMCVSQAHRLNCSYTEELTRELMRRPVTVPQNGVRLRNDLPESEIIESSTFFIFVPYVHTQ